MSRFLLVLLMQLTLGASALTAQAQNVFPQQGVSYGGKVRSGPGLQYGQVGSLRDGDAIRILSGTGVMMDGYEWFQIRYARGRTGFQWGGLMCSQTPYPTIFRNCPNLQPFESRPAPGNNELTILGPSTVTGKTVAKVDYPGGSFKQVGWREWHETGPRGQVRYTFIEKKRDEWSVYLHDASRNVSVQLDLHRKKILIGLASAPNTDLYNIVGVTANPNLTDVPPSGPTGYTVTNVAFPGGKFMKRKNDRWQQRGPNGEVLYGYRENGRDEGAVYLFDRSRNVSVQLDLKSDRVLFGIGTGPKAEIAKITSAGT